MTAINTNVGALNARLYTLGANRAQEQAMERLSSGLRVNSAADDAAGLAVAGSFQGKHPLRVHPERRLFRDDDDQFHHERCRDRHFPAGGSGTGTLPERGSGSDPFRIVGCGGNALSTAGRSSPQRDRL